MSEIRMGSEIPEITPHALLLDVDGPVTHPETKSIKPEMIDKIKKELEAGIPIVLITGRAEKWVSERVEKPLIKAVGNSKVLDNFMMSSEFGGSRVWYENGIRKREIDRSMELPDDLAEKCKLTAQKFAGHMFVDPEKETMVSIEMNDGLTVDEFKPHQQELDRQLKKLVDEAEIGDKFEVHSDTIATNVRSIDSNKRYATRGVLDWLKMRGKKPNMYLVFGDSTSDKEIADELDAQGLDRKFIFVGKREVLAGKADNRTIFPNAAFDDGTLEYLNSL